MAFHNSLEAKSILKIADKKYIYFNINKAAESLGLDFSQLPYSMKVLCENLVRFEDGKTVTKDDIKAIGEWLNTRKSNREIAYRPARVLMQDFTGVPAVVDLAAMRDAMKKLNHDPHLINPLTPVDLVIDHSVQVDEYGNQSAFKSNVDLEMKRNIERYEFLRWGQKAFNNFRVVPPGTGICHQVNLEYLAKVVWTNEVNGEIFAYPDTLVGTDSHTTMVNGLAVLGWGVGGIEAEAAMLGQPISMLIPEVIGVKLTGKMPEGTTATDLVLTVTNILRAKGVVNKFVEFYGNGLNHLTLADRATIANMAPEYGATCGFFPIDDETLRYMQLSGRDEEQITLVKEYAKAQGMWRDENSADPIFTDIVELDLSSIEAALAGPKRPQDKVILKNMPESFTKELGYFSGKTTPNHLNKYAQVNDKDYMLGNGDVTIAAITSCTNTSNPNVLIAAGLVAKKACELGIMPKPWVKTSLAPGSKVVTEYLGKSGLQQYLDNIGFELVGYGCTTCIGNSGPLKKEIEESITKNDVVTASVLSGNRNFEGRVHPLVKANYLASPPLVVAYSLAGTVNLDLSKDPLGKDKNGNDVYLKDLWPSNQEIADYVHEFVQSSMFKAKYADVFLGDEDWQNIKISESANYNWSDESSYIANPPYFHNMKMEFGKLENINDANILAIFGDSITTDHISPAGNISKTSPAAKYLIGLGIEAVDFNSYGARRGNHEIMMRGTFANIRIRNEMLPNTEGGITKYIPTDETMSIYDAAMKYQAAHKNLVVFAGKEYGTGSSRDWAAKGTMLLGVKAVIAESFERIHRSNLVGMGVLPLMFADGMNRQSLNLDGSETITINGLDQLAPKIMMECIITRKNGEKESIKLLCRIDTADEIDYFKNGGILPYVIRNLSESA
jgi:aconitate hydratase